MEITGFVMQLYDAVSLPAPHYCKVVPNIQGYQLVNQTIDTVAFQTLKEFNARAHISNKCLVPLCLKVSFFSHFTNMFDPKVSQSCQCE